MHPQTQPGNTGCQGGQNKGTKPAANSREIRHIEASTPLTSLFMSHSAAKHAQEAMRARSQQPFRSDFDCSDFDLAGFLISAPDNVLLNASQLLHNG
jgi:hypothetical protein